MKKATKLLFAALLVLAAFMTFGCALDIVAPSDQWVEFVYPYETSTGTVKLKCYAYYTETAKQITTDRKSGGEFIKIDIEPGLSMAITGKVISGDSASLTELFGKSVTNDQYVFTTFKNGATVAMNNDSESDTSNDKGFKMGYSTWLVIYNAILHEDTSSKTPDIVKEGEKITAENFKWKKLMYQLAFAKMGDYLLAE